MELNAFLTRDHIAKDTTHHFTVTIHGHDTHVLLDGGTCVNVISPGFLQHVGITQINPVSSISVQTIQGCTKVLGEVHSIPLCFDHKVIVPISGVIIDAPFDLLLGCAFMEATRADTNWYKGTYWMYSQGYGIFIDGTGKQVPQVHRSNSQEWLALKPPSGTNSDSGIPAPSWTPCNVALTPDLDPGIDLDDEASSSESSDHSLNAPSSSGSTSSSMLQDPGSEQQPTTDTDSLMTSEPDLSDDDIFFTQALLDSIENPMSAEEVQAELDNGGFLLWLHAVPTWPNKEWEPSGIPAATSAFLATLDPLPVPMPTLHMVSNAYGFHLEAPRCQDILTDMPC